MAGLVGSGGTGGTGGAGGDGGAGGNGGAVSVTNAQAVTTTGAQSANAILAESLGAIGGTGGTFGVAGAAGAGGASGSLASLATNPVSCIGGVFQGGFCRLTLSWSQGASGSAGTNGTTIGTDNLTGGSGGAVSVTNSGALGTAGAGSDAILAFSMGGVYGLTTYDPNLVFRTGLPVGAQVAGSGAVTVDNSGDIVTSGDESSGVMAQSVASNANAAAVSLTNTADVTTSGDDALGLAAVSRSYSLATSSAGTSGNVTVDNTGGGIATTGNASTGVYAQSMSENGNSGNVTVINDEGSVTVENAGSVAAVFGESRSVLGDAGLVTFNNGSGVITSDTSGSTVALVSLSSAGQSGGVTMVTDGSIEASAASAIAITMDSQGTTTSGNLTFTNGGTVTGAETGTALAFVGGGTNTITNDDNRNSERTATIATSGTVMDYVITATDGDDATRNVNGGVITGSINMGTGANSFLNESGSLYESGGVIFLGAGNTFTNNAYISLGGLGSVMNDGGQDAIINTRTARTTTTLTGNFDQNSTGQMLTNLNFATGSGLTDYADFVNVTGQAALGGFVTLEPTTGAGKPGSFSIQLLEASEITDNGISIFPTFATGGGSDTVVFTPSLHIEDNASPSRDFLMLDYTIDYAPSWLTPNQLSYAQMVNEIQTYGVPAFEPIAFDLLAITDNTLYRQALDSLTGEATATAQHVGLESRSKFFDLAANNARALQNCAKLAPEMRADCERAAKLWLEAKGMSITNLGGYEDGSLHTYNEGSVRLHAGSFSLGSAFELDDGNQFGLILNRTAGNYAPENRWSGGDFRQVNVVSTLSHTRPNGAYVNGGVSLGFGDFSHERLAMGRPVKGALSTKSLGVQVEVGYDTQDLMTPFASYRFDRQTRFAFSEDDTTWGNHYEKETTYSNELEVGLMFANGFEPERGETIMMTGLMSIAHDYSAERDFVSSSLAAPGFYYETTGLSKPETRMNLAFKVEQRLTDNASILLDLQGSFAGSDYSAGSLALSFKSAF